MKKLVGIWLDRQKAVVATLLCVDQAWENGPETLSMQQRASGEEGRLWRASGSRAGRTTKRPRKVVTDGKHEGRRNAQFKRYCKQIINDVRDAEKIIVMGPGEAKFAFWGQMQKTERDMTRRVVGIETCDKMTERQFAARVRLTFKQECPAVNPLPLS